MNPIKNYFKVSSRSLGLVATLLVVMGIPAISHADTLYRELEVGMSGSDVSSVQTFFAQDSTLYPQGLVTGYFGLFTKAAVATFQSRNDIPSVGRIGPITLPILNAQIASGMSSAAAPGFANIAVGVNTNNASVSWNTNQLAKGVVYYSTNPLALTEHSNSVDVSGSAVMTDANFRFSQNVSLPGLSANTVYYYVIYATNQAGNVSITWPATFKTTN